MAAEKYDDRGTRFRKFSEIYVKTELFRGLSMLRSFNYVPHSIYMVNNRRKKVFHALRE